MRRPPISTHFPYTTLFRSEQLIDEALAIPGRYRGLWDALHAVPTGDGRSEEHTSELQSRRDLVCRLLLEKKKSHSDSNTGCLNTSTDESIACTTSDTSFNQ